jgi:hypothetical protein
MLSLTLNRASLSHPSGQRNNNDYDVVADDVAASSGPTSRRSTPRGCGRCCRLPQGPQAAFAESRRRPGKRSRSTSPDDDGIRRWMSNNSGQPSSG